MRSVSSTYVCFLFVGNPSGNQASCSNLQVPGILIFFVFFLGKKKWGNFFGCFGVFSSVNSTNFDHFWKHSPIYFFRTKLGGKKKHPRCS
jgi:hypothetical protein